MRDGEANKDCREVKESQCSYYNQKKYGVFMTFNTFEGARRLKENLKEICFWACDIDKGTKEEQFQRIKQLILKPNIIVESKNGFHCYWRAKDGTKENYQKIVKGIIKKLGADESAKGSVKFIIKTDAVRNI